MWQMWQRYNYINLIFSCNGAPFKYTCPKCNALYCSVACYKSQSHIKCSEEFYKACIQDELASATTTPESQQDLRKIYDILKRMRESDAGFNPRDFDADGLDNPLDSDDDAGSEQADDDEEANIGQPDLAEETYETVDIAERLKGIDINDADEVWSRLNIEEQQEFQKLIANGDIMNLMPDYKPWWCKTKNSKIVVVNSSANNAVNMPAIEKNIPKFSSICKKMPSPCLHYNLWNILSSYACVTRFYNGEHSTNASEAVAHLVNLSSTLKYGTNFEDAEDAIVSVEMEASTTGNGPAGAAAVGSAGGGTSFLVESREQLQEDARQLMATRHHKLAALSDILHLMRQSKVLSKRKDAGEVEFQKLFALASGSVELNRNKLTQLIRKIEFMLSYVTREEIL